MSAETVITQGFGTFGSAARVVTDGYATLAPAVVAPVTQQGGGGGRRKRSYPQYYSRQIYGRKIQLPEEEQAREVAEQVLSQVASIAEDGDDDYADQLRAIDQLARIVASHIESRAIYNVVEEARAQIQAKRDAEIRAHIEAAMEEEKEVTEILEII